MINDEVIFSDTRIVCGCKYIYRSLYSAGWCKISGYVFLVKNMYINVSYGYHRYRNDNIVYITDDPRSQYGKNDLTFMWIYWKTQSIFKRAIAMLIDGTNWFVWIIYCVYIVFKNKVQNNFFRIL